MSSDVDIITVDASNVDKHGFFCYKSKPKTAGYRHKRQWLEERFAEGLRIKIVREGNKSAGFIEYAPGEFAWRAVNAPNYLVVHCMWVVGRGKGKGYGSRLLSETIADAQAMGKDGVAMVTSHRPWLAGSALFLKHGFEPAGEAPPSFELLVKRFGDAPRPNLSHRLGAPHWPLRERPDGGALWAVPIPRRRHGGSPGRGPRGGRGREGCGADYRPRGAGLCAVGVRRLRGCVRRQAADLSDVRQEGDYRAVGGDAGLKPGAERATPYLGPRPDSTASITWP